MHYICDISHEDIDNATLLTKRQVTELESKEDI